MADEITTDQIVDAATGAQEFTGDGQTVKQVPVLDQIEAAKFAAAQKSKRRQGLRFMKLIPPGARGDC